MYLRPLTFLLVSAFATAAAASKNTLPLWPNTVPEETDPKPQPVVSDNTKGDTTRVTTVNDPTLVVYETKPEKADGAAVTWPKLCASWIKTNSELIS